MVEPKRQPEARFQAGGVSASIFINEGTRTDGSVFLTRRTTMQRTFVDSSGKYQTSSNLDVNDLPRAILVLMQAYAHCMGAKRSDGQADGEQFGD